MADVTIHGISSGNKTLFISKDGKRSWYDFDSKKYFFDNCSGRIQSFDEESQFAEAVSFLRDSYFGESIYSMVESGQKRTLDLDSCLIKTGLNLPSWLNK